jgi:hypothetical protein
MCLPRQGRALVADMAALREEAAAKAAALTAAERARAQERADLLEAQVRRAGSDDRLRDTSRHESRQTMETL